MSLIDKYPPGTCIKYRIYTGVVIGVGWQSGRANKPTKIDTIRIWSSNNSHRNKYGDSTYNIREDKITGTCPPDQSFLSLLDQYYRESSNPVPGIKLTEEIDTLQARAATVVESIID